MAERDRPHIIVQRAAAAEPYTRPPLRIEGTSPGAPADRRGHGLKLTEELQDAEAASLALRDDIPEESARAAGIYVTFESFPDVELAFESLDPRQGKLHPELVAVRSVQTEHGFREQAT